MYKHIMLKHVQKIVPNMSRQRFGGMYKDLALIISDKITSWACTYIKFGHVQSFNQKQVKRSHPEQVQGSLPEQVQRYLSEHVQKYLVSL